MHGIKNIMTRVSFLCLLAAMVPAAFAIPEYNMPEGVNAISQEIYSLHMTIFWVCAILSVLVYGIMAYSLFAFRKSRGAVAADFHENTVLEWSWTVLAALVLIVMAVPSTTTLAKIYDSRPGDVNIKVVGYQWKWKYEYEEEQISFFSNLLTPEDEYRNKTTKGEHYLLDVDEPIVVPEGKRIRFKITSNDVVHSFWVIDLGIKQDAIPGYFNTAVAELPLLTDEERAGDGLVLRGVCAELCGRLHGFMPIAVHVVSEQQYQQWASQKRAKQEERARLTSKQWSYDELSSLGQTAYNKNCAVCHRADGKGTPGIFPALDASAATTGDVNVTLDKVVNGVSGTAMQAFGEQLDPIEIASIVTYIRGAWSNSSTEQVSPVQVAEFQSK